jgi:hypothetical protein
MSWADAAVGANRSILQILAQRELQKRQALQDELARMAAARADRGLDLQESGQKFNQERAAAQDAEMAQQRAATQASALGDQLPAGMRLDAGDPAVSIMQQGGRGGLLTGVDPTLGSRQTQGYAGMPGSDEAGATTTVESKPKPTGFLKTASASQQNTQADNERAQAQSEAIARDRAEDNARADRAAAETAAYRRAMLNRPTQGRETFEEWKRKQDYTASLKGTGGDAAAANQANEVNDAIALIDSITSDPALSKAVGPIDAYVGKARALPGVTRFQARQDELLGKLQLAQAGKLKGQGAMSNFEREILAKASTALRRNLSEADYKAELQKIRAQFERMQQGGQAAAPAGGSGFKVTEIR